MPYATRLTFSALVLTGVTAACSDLPTVAPGPAAEADRPSLSTAPMAAGADGSITITINPKKEATYKIGEHKIVFPANSICDPATSSYGVTEWDQPCKPLKKPITIAVDTATTADGHPYVSFSPELRFVPDKNPEHWVVLFLTDRTVTEESAASGLDLLWQAPDGTLVNESLSDPTLATTVQLRGHSGAIVYRRIKHFSGYMVTSRAEATEIQ